MSGATDWLFLVFMIQADGRYKQYICLFVWYKMNCMDAANDLSLFVAVVNAELHGRCEWYTYFVCMIQAELHGRCKSLFGLFLWYKLNSIDGAHILSFLCLLCQMPNCMGGANGWICCFFYGTNWIALTVQMTILLFLCYNQNYLDGAHRLFVFVFVINAELHVLYDTDLQFK